MRDRGGCTVPARRRLAGQSKDSRASPARADPGWDRGGHDAAGEDLRAVPDGGASRDRDSGTNAAISPDDDGPALVLKRLITCPAMEVRIHDHHERTHARSVADLD